MRLPSGDQTGNSATPAPRVSRSAPLPRDKSNSHRSAFVVSSGFVRDATARAPSGERVTPRKPPGSEARPDHRALPVEPGELGIGVSGAVHQNVVGGDGKVAAVTKGADLFSHRHGIPRQRKAPRIERLRHERPFAKEQQPSWARISGRGVRQTNRIWHQPLRALLFRLCIECSDVACRRPLGRPARHANRQNDGHREETREGDGTSSFRDGSSAVIGTRRRPSRGRVTDRRAASPR